MLCVGRVSIFHHCPPPTKPHSLAEQPSESMVRLGGMKEDSNQCLAKKMHHLLLGMLLGVPFCAQPSRCPPELCWWGVLPHLSHPKPRPCPRLTMQRQPLLHRMAPKRSAPLNRRLP